MTLAPSNIIVIDVETNGLYGQPFCVGAVLMDRGGRVLDSFVSRCPIDEVVDEYVENEVLPNIEDIESREIDLDHLGTSFILWYRDAIKGPRPQVLVDVGFPVDCAFLHGLGRRTDKFGGMWREDAPYPLLDLASVLMGLGVDPDIDREKFAKPLIGVAVGKKHSPAWDAEVSGLCFIRAMRPSWEMKNGT